MNEYSEDKILRIAKRYNNTKRGYLLVDPLQAKHMPVSPGEALRLMNTLGAAVREKCCEEALVIGFAETATAMAAAAAECLGDCFYIQTTREDVPDAEEWLYFEEAHSHATEQKLCADNLGGAVTASRQIVFLDDEITTGNTLLNTVNCFRKRFPEIWNKSIAVASAVNRITESKLRAIYENSMGCVYLCRPAERDYEAEVRDIEADEPDGKYFKTNVNVEYTSVKTANRLADPRRGLMISDYRKSIDAFCDEALRHIDVKSGERILVLGTEECMYPALILGKRLEDGFGAEVRCHATTRSPIGISEREGYPITNGYRINSFYNRVRVTYIYNLEKYDRTIVVTDSSYDTAKAARGLFAAIREHGCEKFMLFGG